METMVFCLVSLSIGAGRCSFKVIGAGRDATICWNKANGRIEADGEAAHASDSSEAERRKPIGTIGASH